MTTATTVPGDSLLSPHNAVLALIDFQPLQVSSVASMSRRELVSNVTALARTAKLYGVPTVLSTVNVATGANKPTISQIANEFPGIPPIDRTTLNAWEDPRFRAAIEATQRRKVIFAALWTEVCLAFPVLSALEAGYEAYPVVDAVGGTSLISHNAALRRMELAGARPVSWVQVLCELQRDWARRETVPDFARILFAVEGA